MSESGSRFASRRSRSIRVLSRRVSITAVCILLGGLSAGCRPESTDPRSTPVAFLGDAPLTVSELESYLGANLLEAENEDEPEADAEVRSRLFDAFVEERLLLVEAERRAMPIDVREIALYLGGSGEDSDADGAEDDQRRLEDEARRRLMVQKLLETVLRDVPEVTDAEVRTYVAQNRHRLVPERGLELRALMLESMEKAESVYRDIRRRRITFAEAVVRYEKDPGQGLPMRVALEGLSEEVRTALEDLKPGQVGKPMEVNGNVYIFQVEAWLKGREEATQEQLRLARRELEALRRQEANDALLGEIRKRTPVRLELRNLPFTYVPVETG